MLLYNRQASQLQQLFSQESSRESNLDCNGNLLDQNPYLNQELNGIATNQLTSKSKVYPQIKQEIKSRDSISNYQRAILNSNYYRKYLLKFLQEDKYNPKTQTPKAL